MATRLLHASRLRGRPAAPRVRPPGHGPLHEPGPRRPHRRLPPGNRVLRVDDAGADHRAPPRPGPRRTRPPGPQGLPRRAVALSAHPGERRVTRLMSSRLRSSGFGAPRSPDTSFGSGPVGRCRLIPTPDRPRRRKYSIRSALVTRKAPASLPVAFRVHGMNWPSFARSNSRPDRPERRATASFFLSFSPPSCPASPRGGAASGRAEWAGRSSATHPPRARSRGLKPSGSRQSERRLLFRAGDGVRTPRGRGGPWSDPGFGCSWTDCGGAGWKLPRRIPDPLHGVRQPPSQSRVGPGFPPPHPGRFSPACRGCPGSGRSAAHAPRDGPPKLPFAGGCAIMPEGLACSESMISPRHEDTT